MQAVVDLLVSMVSTVCAWVLDTIFYVFGWLGSWLWEFIWYGVEVFVGLLPDGLKEWLGQDVLATVMPHLQLAAYWVPVMGLLGIFGTTYGMVGSIRLLRNIKGLAWPTGD